MSDMIHTEPKIKKNLAMRCVGYRRDQFSRNIMEAVWERDVEFVDGSRGRVWTLSRVDGNEPYGPQYYSTEPLHVDVPAPSRTQEEE